MSRRREAQKPSIDLGLVERLADLSRLSLEKQDAERLRGELSSILEYFATLDQVDVHKVRPTKGDLAGGLRDDVVRPSVPEVLDGVPQKKGRYVRAPRVF